MSNKNSNKKSCKSPGELYPYAERSREEWINWAESEVVEYKKFLKFLKKKI